MRAVVDGLKASCLISSMRFVFVGDRSMRNENQSRVPRQSKISAKFGKLMHRLCLGEPLRVNEMVAIAHADAESLATKDYLSSINSSQLEETERKPDSGNIEEAETSLRESGSLNYEEARALLGRYEYQRGNIEAALHVFEGIDFAKMTPKMKITLCIVADPQKKPFQNYWSPPLSIHAASLLFEAIFLKAKSLQALRRYKEAAQSCSVILDIVESSLPAGLPEYFGADCKLQDTLNKAIELLPELWKLADSPREAILSYRRALLHQWNLDAKTTTKIEKDFAIFLLHSGAEVIPLNLRTQMDRAYVPKNNTEEAILLLIILLRKVNLKKIEWDPSIWDHLSYALSISGGLGALAIQVEELLPGVIDRKEFYHTLALCHVEGTDSEALELWKKMLRTHTTNIPALLSIAKLCGGSSNSVDDGIDYAQRVIENLHVGCDNLSGAAHLMLGMSCSANSRTSVTNSQRDARLSLALKSLEIAGEMTKMKDPIILYHLSLEYAEQRKLDAALHHARMLVKLEGGSNLKGWILLARILSCQRCFLDAEIIINEALDQTGIWDQGALLRTKAKLQNAQGLQKETLKTYSQLLAIIQVQYRSFGLGKKIMDNTNYIKDLELGMWYDLALIYIRSCRWNDAGICISKFGAFSTVSALRWHAAGLLHETMGQFEEAMKAYNLALEVDPAHVPSLVSMATTLRKVGYQSAATVRIFLTAALRLDRMNASAWYNLGLLHRDGDDGYSSAMKAAECFEASAFLEETEPIEPFR